MTVHPVVGGAFAALDAAGLRWCLLRGRDRLAVPTGDVDLLIERGSAGAVRAAFADVAGVLHQRTWAGGRQSFFLATDSSGWSVVLHAVDRIAFGPLGCFETAEGEGVLARRVERDGVSSADDGDELWVTLVHALADKGEVAVKHRDRLSQLAASVVALDRGLARVVDRLRPGGVDAGALLGLVRDGRWEDVEALAEPLTEAWWRADGATAARRWAAARLSLTSHKVVEHLRRPGLLVAVLAPDGAGKSTVVAALGAPGGLPFPVVHFYAGAYGAATSSRLPAVPGARLAARVWVLASAGVRGRWHRRRRRVALFDRHPLELRLTPSRSLRRALLSRLVPEPDLLLVLDAPGDELHRRSGEHDAATLEEARSRYLALASARPASAVVLDATQPVDHVVDAARQAVVDRWNAR